MKILAIDTSCDESCAAIIDADTSALLADVVHTHSDRMAAFGGIVPEVASREHLKALPLAVSQALSEAGLALGQIDHFAVTHRPGLIGALLVGLTYAKSLAFALGKPFSVHDHLHAHLLSALLGRGTAKAPPPFPWVAMVVSGGHTELFHLPSACDVRWIGGTLDDAAGEAFDKIGKLLGLPYPAGPRIDQWVRSQATAEHLERFALPRSKPETGLFSFSGLKTAVANTLNKAQPLSEDDRLAMAACAQEAILDPLVARFREALQQFPGSHGVATGGVACNSRLRERLPEVYFPAPRHCSDNAAMVAVLAAELWRENQLEQAPFSTTPAAFTEFA